MKVLHISDRDIFGGAARAAHKLHIGLKLKGIDSKMWVIIKASKREDIIPFRYSTNIIVRLKRKIKQCFLNYQLGRYKSTKPSGFERFSDDRSIYHLEMPDWLKEFNIVNLHQVSQILDYKTFFTFAVKNNIPIVWRLADMEPLTGGCHYDWDCNKFIEGCGRCPQLGSDKKSDLSSQVWSRKKEIFDNVPRRLLHVVALSGWMANKVRESPLLNRFPVSVIPNGVDLNIFRPLNKRSSQQFLNLPADKFIVLVLADSLNNERKGLKYAVEALNICSTSNEILLVTVGDLASKISITVPYVHFRKSLENQFLAKLYNAADVFLSTSIYDNFPNTLVESMACGTPSICFDTGGASDIVDDSLNGYKVVPKQTGMLVEKINYLSEHRELLGKFSRDCVAKARDHYDVLLQSKKYIDLYQKVLKSV